MGVSGITDQIARTICNDGYSSEEIFRYSFASDGALDMYCKKILGGNGEPDSWTYHPTTGIMRALRDRVMNVNAQPSASSHTIAPASAAKQNSLTLHAFWGESVSAKESVKSSGTVSSSSSSKSSLPVKLAPTIHHFLERRARDKSRAERANKRMAVGLPEQMEEQENAMCTPKLKVKKKSKRIRPVNSLFRGRTPASSELFLRQQLDAANWAISQGIVRTKVFGEKTYWYSTQARTLFQLPGLDGVSIQGRRLATWAEKVQSEHWSEFQMSSEMQQIYGPDPLGACKRVPSIWLSCIHSDATERGRRSHLEKYGEPMLHVGRKLLELHQKARKSLAQDDPNWDTIYSTFHSLVQEQNQELALINEPELKGDRKDGRFSWSWVRNFGLRLGLQCGGVYSRECKVCDIGTEEDYRKELDSKMMSHSVDPRAIVVYDETNDFFFVPRKRMIVHRSEHKGRQAKARPARHSAVPTGNRRSFSLAFPYGPCHKGKVMLMIESCAEETRSAIQTAFGKDLTLIVNQTGNCYGGSHVDDVIPRVLAPACQMARVSLGLPVDSKVLIIQDRAPGHCQEKCTITGRENLNKVRSEAYSHHNMVNHLMSLNGTPNQCPADQIHGIMKARIHSRLQELSQISVQDLTEMADEVTGKRGGPLISKKGYKSFACAVSLCGQHVVYVYACKMVSVLLTICG